MPFVLEALLSEQLLKLKRKLFEVKIALLPWRDEIIFYHRLNDPYSYLLLLEIMKLEQKYLIKVSVELLFELPPDLNPEPKKLAKYALKDANLLAKLHNIDVPEFKKAPTRRNTFQATSCLLKQKPQSNNKAKRLHFLQLVSELTGALWENSSTTLESCLNRYGTMPERKAKKALDLSQQQLLSRGHYMSAMINYGGEWYWGVDRLNYLTQRIGADSAQAKPPAVKSFADNYLSLTLKLPNQNSSVDFYFSFRSPYSYLAAEKLFQMAAQQQFDVNIKPVLPMVMRGFKVPMIKRQYIVADVKREALKQGVPFGRICDPLGIGIDRCMALFPYAKSEAKERAFIASICRGIWAEGADVSLDDDLEKLITRAGLSWHAAQKWLTKTDWRIAIEDNRKQLEQLGLWGVPSFVSNKKTFWGQDRLTMLELSIKQSQAKPKDSKV